MTVVVNVEFNAPINVVHTHCDVDSGGLTACERKPFLQQDSAGCAHRGAKAPSGPRLVEQTSAPTPVRSRPESNHARSHVSAWHPRGRIAGEGIDMSDMLDTRAAWLSESDLESARERVPMVYVDAVPVRTDERGQVTTVGLLLRGLPDGSISRAVVSGRVLYGERVRDALLRHLEKDLGPMALPQVPTTPQPFTIVEYFPDETVTGFHDPRQHAVSLAYVVPIDGDCAPSQDALDLVWMTPGEATSPAFQQEMSGGQGRLIRMALAHSGQLP